MGSWLDHVQKHLKYSKYSWFTFSDIYKTPKSDINCFTFYPTTVFPPGLNWTHWSWFVVLILFNELTCQGRAWCCSLWWRRLVIYTTCCTSLYFSFSGFIYQVYECVFACEWAWGLCSSLVLTLIRVQVYLISVQVCLGVCHTASHRGFQILLRASWTALSSLWCCSHAHDQILDLSHAFALHYSP